MKKRFVKPIFTEDFKDFFELSIEDCINRYAKENDLTIIQFQVHNDTYASVLYEENFERSYRLPKIIPMDNIAGFFQTYICSNCGIKCRHDAEWCLNCNSKLEYKPSN